MKNLWLVEQGQCLRGLSLKKPTQGALSRHALTDCSVRLSPVAPHQLTLTGESDTFNLRAEVTPTIEHKANNDDRQQNLF